MARRALEGEISFGDLENVRQVALYQHGRLGAEGWGGAGTRTGRTPESALDYNVYLGNFGPDKGYYEFSPSSYAGQIAAIHAARGALGNYSGPLGEDPSWGPFDTVGQLRAARDAAPYYLRYRMGPSR